jgi:outer membrane lipoprotein LolB
LLSACTGINTRKGETANTSAYKTRAGEISAIANWSLSGRLSLDDGEDGGSGKLQWRVSPESSSLDFFAAMGRGAWYLEVSETGASLRDSEGVHTAVDVETLVMQKLGWPVPVEALHWWARGLIAPGKAQTREVDAQGLLVSLNQFGWNINISRYDEFNGQLLPVRLEARHKNYRVKMAISQWQFQHDLSMDN